jgi:hypothetical protein
LSPPQISQRATRQGRPVNHNLEQLSDTWDIVFNGADTNGNMMGVYEQVSTDGGGQVRALPAHWTFGQVLLNWRR